MRRVLEAKDHFRARATKVEAFDKLFGSSKADSHFRKSEADNQEEIANSFYISDATIASSADAYVSILSANMHNKMFQHDTWTVIEDFWSFLQLVILRCTIETLFGSALLKQYPRMVRDYISFNAAAEGFMPGMPRLMFSGVSEPRNSLYKGMETWLPTDRGESTEGKESDKATSDHSNWDERTGLEFIRERYSSFNDTTKFGDQTRKETAAEVLSILHTYVASSSAFINMTQLTAAAGLTANFSRRLSGQLSKRYESRTLSVTWQRL